MRRILIPIIALLGLLFSFSGKALAFKADTFVTFVHTVDDFKVDPKTKLSPLDVPRMVYEESTRSAVFNTWLLTPKAVESATISAYFKKISSGDKRQELGLFLQGDVLDSLHKETPEKREFILDRVMNQFFDTFGFYPKTISSKLPDTHSLEYLQSKYSVLGVVITQASSEQLPSNRGAYSYSPYFPDKKNYLMPAKSFKTRINLSISEEVNVDNFNLESKLPLYTQKTFNEFALLNLSTHNSSTIFDIKKYKVLVAELLRVQGKYDLNFITYSSFSDWFKARYPESTPASFYKQENQVGISQKYIYQSPWYKMEFFESAYSISIKKLYVYNHKKYEPNISTPSLASNSTFSVDEMINSQVPLLIKKQQPFLINYLKQTDFWTLTLQNSSEKLILRPDEIQFTNLDAPTFNSPLLIEERSESNTTLKPIDYEPFQNKSFFNLLFWVITISTLAYLLYKNGKPPFFGLFLALLAGFTSFGSGRLYPFGMGFWGPNGHDAIFHLSIIQKFVAEPLNLSHPQISGLTLSNYHFAFDYLSALVVKLTDTPVIFFYFFVFPLVCGLVLVKLLSLLFDNFNLNSFQKNFAYALIFLGSSFGYLVRLFQNNNFFSGESVFWANQSASMFLNPPFVLSVIVIIAFLNLYQKSKKTLLEYILLVVLGAILAQVKVYGFILLCLGLLLQGDFLLLLLVGTFGTLINLPVSSLSGFPFVFDPLWFIRSMFASPDRFYIERIAQSWQAYEATGSMVKLLVLNLLGVAIFFVGNLGARIFGLFSLLTRTIESKLDGLTRKMVLISLVIPLLFVQRINPWNSIQFLYYGMFFLAIYSAKFFSKKTFLSIVVLILGIFGSLGTLKDYFTKNSASRISYIELSSLTQLSQEPKGVVLSPLPASWGGDGAPLPLYKYVTSSYVSGLSGQPEFLSDLINLDITEVSYEQRANEVQKFYKTNDLTWARDFLKENNIKYILETPAYKINQDYHLLNLVKIFDSEEVNLYKLN